VTLTEGATLPRPGEGPLALRFLTPMNAEGDDPLDRPATILARLARRVEGMARWQDAGLAVDWAALGRLWSGLEYDVTPLLPGRLPRRSGRTGQRFGVETVAGSLLILDPPAALLPLLRIGVATHVGKGASEGHGRFVLEPAR
jgi:hypothetical protein